VVADPIHLQMGNGENELVINIEEDGINYIWTKKTYWKITTDFLWNVVNTIVDRIGSIVGNALAIGTSAMKSITSK
jgi:phage-related protein